MATQKDFIVKNGLQVKGGNIVTSDGSLSIVDQISGDTGQITINNGQQGNSFMRMGMIGGGDANSFIRTDRTLEFHIGQSATSATPTVSIDTSGNIKSTGVIESSGGDTATSGQLLNLHGSSVNQTNSGTIRFTEASYDTSPFFQGGFIKYDGSGNQLKIGTHHTSDSNLSNDIDAITIARSTGDTTLGQIIQSNRDIRSAGQIRATGWYNATASTDYTGMALEIGVSGSQPHILAYNRSTQAYGALVISSAGLTINPRSSDVTIQGVVNLTSSGHLEINGTTVITSSRNLTNIGTISNSAFTIPNSIGTVGQVLKVPSTGTTLEWVADTSGAVTSISNNVDNRILTATGGTTINGETNLSFNGSTLTVNADADFNGANADLQWDSSADSLIFNDNAKATFGNSNDLQIYHAGNYSVIDNLTHGLVIRNQANNSDIILQSDDGAGSIADYLKIDGSTGETKLSHYGSEKISTKSTGIDVTGTITADGLDLSDGSVLNVGTIALDKIKGDADDNTNITFAGNDTTTFNQGGTQRLSVNTTGINVTGTVTSDGLTVDGGSITVNNYLTAFTLSNNSNQFMDVAKSFFVNVDSDNNSTSESFNVTYDNRSKKALTVQEGGDVSFYDDSGTSQNLKWDASADSLNFVDNAKAIFGTGSDFEIYHDQDGPSYIRDRGSSDLVFTSNGSGFKFRNDNSTEILADLQLNGAVTLYYDNSPKLATTSGGVSISGELNTTGNIAINKDVAKLTINNNVSNGQASIDINNTGLYARYILDGDDLFRIYNQTGGFDTFAVKSDGDLYMGSTKWFDLSRNLTNIGTISSGSITATAPIKVLQPSSSAINELLVLEADDPNADIIMTDNTGSIRLRTSGNGDFKIFTGGSATSQNASGATHALTIDQSQNATFNNDVEVIGNLDGTTADFGGAVSIDSLKQGLTTVLDSSRNLTNLNSITLNGSLGTWSVDNQGAIMNFSRNTANYIRAGSSSGYLVFQTGGSNTALTLDGSQNATFTGTINSGAITSSGNIQHTGLTMTSGTDVDQIYQVTKSITLSTSWQDTGIIFNNLATGSYILQVQVNDHSVGGQQYNEHYTGVMSWYTSSTNSTNTDEILLHRAGHASNNGDIFLRTARTASNTSPNLHMEIRGATNNTGASNYVFKFRRLI